MKSLEEVKEILSTIPNINRGGCGFSALFMYLSCRDKFRYHLFSGHTRYDDSLDGIKDNSNLSACHHVFLYDEVDKIFFDCKKEVSILSVEVLERIDLEKLVSIIKGPKWNPDFDRTCVPKIEKKTGISLKEFNFPSYKKQPIVNRLINLVA